VNLRRGLIAGSAIVLGSVLMLSLVWGLQHAAVKAPVLGSLAPRLAIQTSGGAEVRVWELRGKPVVLNFWASWCTTCAQELPVLSSAYSSHSDMAFLGANVQDTSAGEQGFEKVHPHPYPVGPVVTGDYRSYGVIGLPVTFFIDSAGLVKASFAGPLDSSTLDRYLGLLAA
jgi:cytochrome c biogenesis protein CcmG/thiol:disulfide interchange protein DsbE